MTRIGSIVAAALGVAVFATPALPVTIANSQWSTKGRSVAVVKGLGKAKNDAELLLTFFTGGDARGVDAFDRTFLGTYVVTGKKQNKAEISLDTASTTLLEDVIEGHIEDAVLRKAKEVVDVRVDIGTVRTKAHFNKNGTKVKLKMKVKGFGSADIDPRRRKTTYTVRTKGGPSL
jgi:hypothetical protein